MQNIVKFFTDFPDEKINYEKAGESFNNKWNNHYFKINQEHLINNENLNFESKWSEFKPVLENLKIDKIRKSRCFICTKDLNDSDCVEHYRPKGSDKKDKEKLYWWLAYDYKNYYLICKDCNTKKLDSFPIKNEKDRVNTPSGDIDLEKPLLLNPMLDNPADYFKVALVQHPIVLNRKILIILPKDNLETDTEKYERALTTIKIFNLDLKYLDFLEKQDKGEDIDFQELQKLKKKTTDRRIQNCLSFYEETELKLLINNFPSESDDSKTKFYETWQKIISERKSFEDWGLAQLIYNFQFQDFTKIDL